MSLLHRVNRADFLALVDLSSEAFGRRAAEDHVALAFGCEVPAAQGQYLTTDAAAMALTDGLVAYGIAGRKLAAILTRMHHQSWYDALREFEWGSGLAAYFAVGFVCYPPDIDLVNAAAALGDEDAVKAFADFFHGFFVATGSVSAIAEAVERKRMHPDENERGFVTTLVILHMGQVWSTVYARAKAAGIGPPRLTMEPGTPDEAALWAEVAEHQKESQARLRDKGRTRVRVPRSVRMSEVDNGKGKVAQ